MAIFAPVNCAMSVPAESEIATPFGTTTSPRSAQLSSARATGARSAHAAASAARTSLPDVFVMSPRVMLSPLPGVLPGRSRLVRTDVSPWDGWDPESMLPPSIAFATPRKLPKAKAVSGNVVVLDIAFAGQGSSGGFHGVTMPFIAELGDRLRAWVDHHDHEEHARFAGDPRFVLSTKAEHGACPEMIDEALVRRVGAVDTIVCHTDFDGLASAAKWMR